MFLKPPTLLIKRSLCGALLAWSIVSLPSFALAQALTGLSIGAGPVAVGKGGANPPSSNPLNLLQIGMLFQKAELLVSVVPGIFYSYRMNRDDWYLTFGAGMMLDARGLGPGMGLGLGYHIFCYGICLDIDFRKSLGVPWQPFHNYSKMFLLSNYSLRLGASVHF